MNLSLDYSFEASWPINWPQEVLLNEFKCFDSGSKKSQIKETLISRCIFMGLLSPWKWSYHILHYLSLLNVINFLLYFPKSNKMAAIALSWHWHLSLYRSSSMVRGHIRFSRSLGTYYEPYFCGFLKFLHITCITSIKNCYSHYCLPNRWAITNFQSSLKLMRTIFDWCLR